LHDHLEPPLFFPQNINTNCRSR